VKTRLAVAFAVAAGFLLCQAAPALAATGPVGPKQPTVTKPGTGVNISVNGQSNNTLTIILLLTVLSVAPSVLILMTSFTKMVVVLSLTRNALGLQGVPPNQVLAGLALFLSLFVMGPTLSKVNSEGVQPWLHHTKTQPVALRDGEQPLRQFMLKQTQPKELSTLISATHQKQPKTPNDVSMTTLIPAFILSELRSAFIIGFVIFIPFLVIDLVVSSTLMSMGMMMMPPVLVSLPFKLLLFVMVDGWGLVARSLLRSYG
jgi:flagellar biosynthetic protein FliP